MNNKKYNKDLIKFYEYGIWIVDEKVKFYKQNTSTNLTGGSITNLFENSEFDLLQCYKLSTLMKKIIIIMLIFLRWILRVLLWRF